MLQNKKKKKKITPQNLNIYIQFFIYLITFLAFVTIREKKNESKRFWFRVTISFRIALKKFFFFGLFKNCTAEFQMSWYLLLRRRSPPEVQQWRISHFKLGWKLDEMAKKKVYNSLHKRLKCLSVSILHYCSLFTHNTGWLLLRPVRWELNKSNIGVSTWRCFTPCRLSPILGYTVHLNCSIVYCVLV